MKSTREWLKTTAVATALWTAAVDISRADDEDVTVWVTRSGPRFEAALGVQSWPALSDLDVAQDGSFDNIGFNLGMAVHFPWKRIGRSELLAGVDLAFLSNESDIGFTSDTLVARNAYITPSLKWMFANSYSLDAGIGYYYLDMAEIAGEYPAYFETRLWDEGAVGGYVGATVDIPNRDPSKNHGISINLKVHFVEFGRVSDELIVAPVTLGPDAGDLSGPIYAIQFGYRWR